MSIFKNFSIDFNRNRLKKKSILSIIVCKKAIIEKSIFLSIFIELVFYYCCRRVGVISRHCHVKKNSTDTEWQWQE